jgi:hypothetical protein
MLNWYCEYLCCRFRMLESACAAEAGRRLSESRSWRGRDSTARPRRTMAFPLNALLVLMGRSLQKP